MFRYQPIMRVVASINCSPGASRNEITFLRKQAVTQSDSRRVCERDALRSFSRRSAKDERYP